MPDEYDGKNCKDSMFDIYSAFAEMFELHGASMDLAVIGASDWNVFRDRIIEIVRKMVAGAESKAQEDGGEVPDRNILSQILANELAIMGRLSVDDSVTLMNPSVRYYWDAACKRTGTMLIKLGYMEQEDCTE